MAQTIEQGDVFGRMGRSFGEGFSGQVDRSMLAGQLEKAGLPKNVAGLAQHEGGKEYIPLVQQYARGQAYLKGGQAQEAPPVSETTAPPTSQKPSTLVKEPQHPISENKSLLAPKEEVLKFKHSLKQEPTPEEISELGRKYYGEGRFNEPNEAENFAKQKLQEGLTAQNTKLTNFEKGFNKRAALDLQSGGLSDFSQSKSVGAINNRLLDEGKYLIGQGATPDEAEQKMSDVLLDLGKAMTQVRKTGVSAGSFIPGSGKNEKSRAADIKSQRKVFEDYGFQEEFDDIAAAAAGVTPMKIASIVEPVKNKEFQNVVKKEGKNKLIHGFISRLGDKELDRLAASVTPEDNILSLEHSLRDNRISIPEFREKLLEPQYYKKLTDKQKRQLSKEATNSVLDDILFEIF